MCMSTMRVPCLVRRLADATGAWSYATFNSSGSGQGNFVCMCPACMAARAEEAAHGGGITTPLADGQHTFTVAAVDTAGNFSAVSSVLSVTIDTAAPVPPTIASFSTDSGVVGDRITNDNTLTLTGTAEANARSRSMTVRRCSTASPPAGPGPGATPRQRSAERRPQPDRHRHRCRRQYRGGLDGARRHHRHHRAGCPDHRLVLDRQRGGG